LRGFLKAEARKGLLVIRTERGLAEALCTARAAAVLLGDDGEALGCAADTPHSIEQTWRN
jgi:hypothetical protein